MPRRNGEIGVLSGAILWLALASPIAGQTVNGTANTGDGSTAPAGSNLSFGAVVVDATTGAEGPVFLNVGLTPPPFPGSWSGSLGAGDESQTYRFSAAAYSAAYSFYFAARKESSCSSSGCAGSIELRFFSRYGTVSGRVMYNNGTPAAGVSVVASDPGGMFQSRTRVTDAGGFYDFTASTFADLVPEGLGQGIFPGVMAVPTGVKWGLPITGKGDGISGSPYETAIGYSNEPGERIWRLAVGSVAQDIAIRSNEEAVFMATLPIEDVVKNGGNGDDPGRRPGESEREPEKKSKGEEGEKAKPEPPPECAGQPVSIATGNVFLDQVDAVMGGLRQPLVFSRSYNSQRAYGDLGGMFGRGWTHSFEKAIFELTPAILKLTRESGMPLYYSDADGDQTYTPMLPKAEQSSVVKTLGGFVRHFLRGGHQDYDAQGRFVGETDKLGNSLSVTYEDTGSGFRISSIRDPNGRAFTFQYQFGGGFSLIGPEGTIATYEFGSSDQVQAVKYADGTGYRFFYDYGGFAAGGQLLVMTDLQGRVLEKHEYSGDKATTSELADGREKLTFSYQDDRTIVTDALGRVATYELANVAGMKRVTRVTGCSLCGGAGGDTQTWTFDPNGRVASYSNGLNQTTAYTYDADGNMASMTNPLSDVTTLTYNSEGRLTSRGNPDGSSTAFAYAQAGPGSASVSVSPGVTRSASIGYDSLGRETSVTDPRGKTWTYNYNTSGDLASVTDPLNHTTTYGYDAMGRRTSITDALSRTSTIAYDVRGRVRRATGPDGAVSEFEYDDHGDLAKTKDPLGRTTGYTYDPYGRIEAVVDATGGTTRYSYALTSDLIGLTDARGQTTSFEYDAFNRLSKTTYPGGGFETNTYDAAARLQTHTDRRGIVSTFSYDAAGRLIGKSYSDGTPAVSYGYGTVGRLVSATNGADTLTWTYDLAGQVVSEQSARAATTVGYLYDDGGNRTALSLNGSAFLSYAYDDASRLLSLSRGSNSFVFGYDAVNRRISLSYPNGVTTSYSYDLASRLLSLTTMLGPTPIASASYAYDKAGTRTRKTTEALVEDYLYDDLYRLTGVNRTGGASRLWRSSYDRVGNRTQFQADDAVVTLSYDNGNRITSQAGGGSMTVRGQLSEAAGVKVNGQPAKLLSSSVFEAEIDAIAGTNFFTVEAKDASGNTRTNTYEVDVPAAPASYTYDSNGNVTSKTEASVTTTYEWDAVNRLRRVVRDGNEIASFQYDALGRRIEKTTTSGTIAYVYDGSGILRESSSTGTLSYIQGPGIDEALAREDSSSALQYYHADGLGSIVKMTDQAGIVTLARQYDAWGNLGIGTGEPGYAFTGREWDPETGLYYYRARYYDPRLGRFISEDPIGFDGGINLYAYVGSDPVLLRDPSGEGWWIPIVLAVAYVLNNPTNANVTQGPYQSTIVPNPVLTAGILLAPDLLPGRSPIQDPNATRSIPPPDPNATKTIPPGGGQDHLARQQALMQEMLRQQGGYATNNPDGSPGRTAQEQEANLRRFLEELNRRMCK